MDVLLIQSGSTNSLVPLFHLAAGGLIAIGIGMAIYENREELLEALEDCKYGIEAAIERKRKRMNGISANSQPSFSTQNGNQYDDDDLYHTPNASDPEAVEATGSTTESDIELWDSTRTLTARDGQTSGIYDRKATFRSRRGGGRRAPEAQNPPHYTFSSESGQSTELSSTSSGEETPEDEVEKYLANRQRTAFN